MWRTLQAIARTLGRGVFPHQFSFLLELPARQLVLSPRELVRRLRLNPQSRVLEVGSGSGYYSARIAADCRELVLLDLQREMLRKAMSRIRHAGVDRVGFVVADASRLPFDRDSFDVIYMVAVFGEVSRQRELILEMHRILKPDGILSISEHLPDPDFTRFSKLKVFVRDHGFELDRHAGWFWTYTANFKKLTSPNPAPETRPTPL